MSQKYKNTVTAILLACILTMAIGYAVLQKSLNVEGSSRITSDFNIQITGIREIMKDGLADTVNIDYGTDFASYSANIQSPGDIVVYEITVENKGNLWGYANPEEGLLAGNDLDGNVLVGVMAVSTTQLSFTDYEDFDNNIMQYMIANPNGEMALAPGDKAYYYAAVVFNHNATDLPTIKDYEVTNTFVFDHVNADGSSPYES